MAEEAEELREYIDDPACAPALTDSIRAELTQAEDSEDSGGAEVDHIVANLEDKVLESIGRLKKTKHIRMPLYWRYAAVIAGLLLATGTIFYSLESGRDKDGQSAIVVANKDILPGSGRATLLFGSDSYLTLSEAADGITMSGNQVRYKNGALLLDEAGRESFTLTVPRSGKYKITLADGTRVWLNAASSITYPGVFKGSKRSVEVQGEVYFEVAHDSKHPFIVNTEGQAIEVLGTAFNVNTYTKGKAVTTLINGRIALRTVKGLSKVLSPGDQAVVRGEVVKINKVNVQDYVGWKDGLIVFNDQHIHDIFKQLERWYDVEFVNIESISADKKLSGEIPGDTTLSVILQAIEVQLNVKFEINGRRIMIKN